MDIVPNAAFDAAFPADPQFEHPPGCYLARKLQQSLSAVASTGDDFDNWRGSGWVVTCEVEGREFEVYFAGLGTGPSPTTWRLAVAPLRQPGWFRKLLGAKVSPYGAQSKVLTAHIHGLLMQDAHVSHLRWAMNADPAQSKVTDPSNLSWGSENAA